MADSIIPFDFEGSEVRFIGTIDRPAWVAADVCKILDLDTSLAINGRKGRPGSGLDEDEKGTAIVSTLGGDQEVLTVNESGLYSLILKSRKPQAKRMKKWVTSDVLPSIRKTGRYEIPTQQQIVLPPADVRISNLHNALTGFGIDISNPRYSQAIKDLVINNILSIDQLPPADKPVWLGVAEKAERMGYPVDLVVKYRSSLGRFVASHGLESTKETRLCNGRMSDINLYLDCPELESAIAEYLDAKILKAAA